MPKRAKVSECSIEMVYDINNLILAHQNARKKKTFYKEVKMVDANPGGYLFELQEKQIDGTYKISDYEIFWKQEGEKLREIYKLPYYPDRIHQWAIIQVIEPFLIRHMTEDTYSAIPERGTFKAYKKLVKALKTDPVGTRWCLKIDIKKYYPSIPKDKLKEKYESLFKDKGILKLLFEIIDSTPGDRGIPIGNYISQYSGNIYLSDFDHKVKEGYKVKHYFRYMDDMVFLAKTKEELQLLVKKIIKFLKDVLGLEVKSGWSLFFVEDRGINFIGYIFKHSVIRLRRNIVKTLRNINLKIKKRVNKGLLITYRLYCGINSLVGWLKHCDSGGLKLKYVDIIWDHVTAYHSEVIMKRRKMACV